MRVGIDFDNTIAGYDRVFVAAAQARGWVAADFRGSKRELRDTRAAPPRRRDQVADAAGRGLRRAHGGGDAVSGRDRVLQGGARTRLGVVHRQPQDQALGLRSAADRPAAGGAGLARGARLSRSGRLRARARAGVLRGYPRRQDRAHQGDRMRGLHRRPRGGVRRSGVPRRDRPHPVWLSQPERPERSDHSLRQLGRDRRTCPRRPAGGDGRPQGHCRAARRRADPLARAGARRGQQPAVPGRDRARRAVRAQDLCPPGERPARPPGHGIHGARVPASSRHHLRAAPDRRRCRRRLRAPRMDRG